MLGIVKPDAVVLVEGGQEDDGHGIVHAVDPLPPFSTLAAHVHHPTHQSASHV